MTSEMGTERSDEKGFRNMRQPQPPRIPSDASRPIASLHVVHALRARPLAQPQTCVLFFCPQKANDRISTPRQDLLASLALVLHREDTGTLLGDTLGAALAGGLVLDAASLGLVGEELGAVLLGLGLVDVLHENAL